MQHTAVCYTQPLSSVFTTSFKKEALTARKPEQDTQHLPVSVPRQFVASKTLKLLQISSIFSAAVVPEHMELKSSIRKIRAFGGAHIKAHRHVINKCKIMCGPSMPPHFCSSANFPGAAAIPEFPSRSQSRSVFLGFAGQPASLSDSLGAVGDKNRDCGCRR